MAESERWAAVVARNAAYDGKFVYCVKTTKIFCRPICKARLARRANVEFCDTPAEAESAGFRACKRCQPLLASYNPEAEKVKTVCAILDDLDPTARIPDLEQLAGAVKLTKHHFHRLFKRETGLTPRQYVLSSRSAASSGESPASAGMMPATPVYGTTENTPPTMTVTTTFEVDDLLDVSSIDPALLEAGKDLTVDLESFTIYYSIVETTCGLLLVAFQRHEVCQLEFGATPQDLLNTLEVAFPSLYYFHCPVEMAREDSALYLQQRVTAVVEALEMPNLTVQEQDPFLVAAEIDG